MSGPLDDQLGFAPDYDSPVPYMQRTRDYYIAIGYTTPYAGRTMSSAVPAVEEAAGAVAGHHRHHGGPV